MVGKVVVAYKPKYTDEKKIRYDKLSVIDAGSFFH